MTPFFVIVGTTLRLGIPVLVTLALAWWLHRLDVRWQREARPARPPAHAPQTPPCWEVQGCSLDSRQACESFAHPETPCWQLFRQPNGELRPACLDCQVFRDAPVEALPGKEISHV